MDTQEQEVAIEKNRVVWLSLAKKEKLPKTEFAPIFANILAEDGNYRFVGNKWHTEEIEVIGLTSNYDKNIDWLRANYNLYKRQYRDYAVDCNVILAEKNDYFLKCQHVGSGSQKLIIEKENNFFETFTVNKAAFYMDNAAFKEWVEGKLENVKDSDFMNWKKHCDEQYFRHRFDR